MAQWRERGGRLEAPEWYRNFHPEDWDEPDEHELRMMAGNLGCPWPEVLHGYHVERRWEQAKYQYRRDNSAFGTQEFDDLIARCRERRGSL